MTVTTTTEITANKPRLIKRAINGVLLLDKPAGISSNDALQRVKRLYQAKKAGHTGSLDPLATGMLPICFGEATKLSQFLLNADKTYVVTAKLGLRTETSDSEGEVIAKRAVPALTKRQIEKALRPFRGDIQQVPSMYSALKYKGQPLYKLARQGIEVVRESRAISIYKLSLLQQREDELELFVHCSKGTYVRTLVDDLGEVLGCGAHVVALRRENVAQFAEVDMVAWPDLLVASEQGLTNLDQHLLPMEKMVSHFPQVVLEKNSAFYLRQGQAVMVPNGPTSGMVALLDKNKRFFGVGEVLSDGKIAPKRLIKTAVIPSQ